MKKLYLPAIAILTLPAVCQGASVYVSHSGAGDGSSCESPVAEAGVNLGTLGDGGIVWVCDDGGILTDVITLNGNAGETYYIYPAPGDAPNIGPTGQYGMHAGTPDQGFFIIDGLNTLTFSGGVGANSTPLRFNSQTGFKVLRSRFTSQNSYYAIQAYVSTIDAANVEIAYNTFDLGDTVEAIRVNHVGTTGKTYHDWNIHDNHTVNAKYFFFDLADAAVYSSEVVAYGFNFSYNTAEHIHHSFFSPGSGIGTNGGTSVSYIGHNYIDFCGDSDQGLVNCFQMHNIGDANLPIIFEYNQVNHTYTSECDGGAYIFDWANNDAALYSQNLIIRYNEAYDYNSVCGGKGFSAYRLKDSVMHHNIANGATTSSTPVDGYADAGFEWAWTEGTGNVAYNNTSINHVAGAAYKISDAALVGNPEVEIYNSIGANALLGFQVINNSAAPNEHNNFIFDVGSNSVALDATTSTDNPYLSSTGKPTSRSPYAIKRGGLLVDGSPSIAGRWGYIGAYPWYEGIITPWNIALNIPSGPGRIGGGVIYDAPDFYMLMETSDYFLMETGDKFILE